MNIKVIDTHAHWYLKEFKPDFEETFSRAKEVLHKILLPNIDLKSITAMHRLADTYPDFCFPMMGLHPCSVKAGEFERVLEEMEMFFTKPIYRYAAVGETGLDLYWDKTTLEIQKMSLNKHIEWAKKYKLPLVLHCRDSFAETIELIEAAQDGTLKGVFHCFGGTLDEARRVMQTGFYVGIGGIITYKNCAVAEVLPQIDPEKILLETDCPYLPPIPHRGKRNEPSFISLTAQKVADALSLSYEEMAELTTKNAFRLFGELSTTAW